MVAVCVESDYGNRIQLLSLKTGQDLCDAHYCEIVPMTLTYVEQQEVLVVGTNSTETFSSQLLVLKLLNEDGILELKKVKSLEFNGLILELQSLVF